MQVHNLIPLSIILAAQLAFSDVAPTDSTTTSAPDPAGEDAHFAPKAISKNDALTIHPILSIAVLGVHASYEGALGNSRWAYEIPIYFGYSERMYSNPTLFLGSGLGLRHYIAEVGQGAYLEPELECLNKHQFASGEEPLNNILFLMPSIRMGYKKRWKTVVLDFGLGTGFLYGTLTEGTATENDGWGRMLIPTGNLAIGIPF